MKKPVIDFVIPWVDGSDPEWKKEKDKVRSDGDGRAVRYRDWDNLQFWFRGVEKFAPWVNRIFFVTCGQKPEWLNTEHPKLRLVNHTDYIPARYLPTFNANTIELNLHRIPDLSERFVYFNDDMFLLKAVTPEMFFRKGLPCDTAAMNPADTMQLNRAGDETRVSHFAYNDIQYINKRYSFRKTVAEAPRKWLNPRYGSYLARNLLLLAWPRFTGFVDFHLPQPYLKSSFRAAWKDEKEILDRTCRNALRTDQDVNQWYIRYRQMAENRFYASAPADGASYCIDGTSQVEDVIRQQGRHMICINDSPVIDEIMFEREKERLIRAFSSILPQKSEYEL